MSQSGIISIAGSLGSPVTVPNGGTGSSSFNINGAVISGTTTTSPLTALTMTNGQLLIGRTGLPPVLGTITSTGGSVAITLGAGTINIEASGPPWTDVTTATQALLVNNGYVTDRGAGVTYTLPATAVLGNQIQIVGKLGITTIAQNAGQQILMSSASSTVGVTGSIVGTNVGDCVTLICITAGASTVWRAISFVGNWTVN